MEAHNLFDYQGCDTKNLPPLSHTNDPQTSFDAADKMIKSGKLKNQWQIVHRGITHYLIGSHQENFTAKEVAKWMLGHEPTNYYMIQRRLSDLRNKGKIERINSKGETYVENKGQKPLIRDGCCVWRLK